MVFSKSIKYLKIMFIYIFLNLDSFRKFKKEFIKANAILPKDDKNDEFMKEEAEKISVF